MVRRAKQQLDSSFTAFLSELLTCELRVRVSEDGFAETEFVDYASEHLSHFRLGYPAVVELLGILNNSQQPSGTSCCTQTSRFRASPMGWSVGLAAAVVALVALLDSCADAAVLYHCFDIVRYPWPEH